LYLVLSHTAVIIVRVVICVVFLAGMGFVFWALCPDKPRDQDDDPDPGATRR
jgi:hypothetical protein